MIIQYDPDEWVEEVDINICDFHKQKPNVPFAGCSCSSSYRRKRATPEQYKANKLKSLKDKRERLIEEYLKVDMELNSLIKELDNE